MTVPSFIFLVPSFNGIELTAAAKLLIVNKTGNV
jgi:hypothetical protein